ncbi:phosphopantothenoylcysteine decarboxylase, partial [Tremellales sp. Uapishka_1]
MLAGPSRIPHRSPRPFVSADNRPSSSDGVLRVVIISTGSVASVKIPEIVGALSRDASIAVQVVATKASLHFYNQAEVDKAVRAACGADEDTVGVQVWTDEDEWSDWRKIGDPILHIELRRWADLVVIAPCSADFLAKIASGLSENLPLSLLRALPPSTPTIICPAMNTQMYIHPFTAKHLRVIQEELQYMVLGPQEAGTLACGDDGPGKMTDWRDIVTTIQGFAGMFKARVALAAGTSLDEADKQDTSKAIMPASQLPQTLKTYSSWGPYGGGSNGMMKHWLWL